VQFSFFTFIYLRVVFSYLLFFLFCCYFRQNSHSFFLFLFIKTGTVPAYIILVQTLTQGDMTSDLFFSLLMDPRLTMIAFLKL